MVVARPLAAFGIRYFAFGFGGGIDEHVGGVDVHLISLSFFDCFSEEYIVAEPDLMLELFVDWNKLNFFELEESLAIFIDLGGLLIAAAQVNHVVGVSQRLDFYRTSLTRIAFALVDSQIVLFLLKQIVFLLVLVHVLIGFDPEC